MAKEEVFGWASRGTIAGILILACWSGAVAQQRSGGSEALDVVLRYVIPEWSGKESDIPRKCGTPIFVQASLQWERLSIMAKQEIKTSFARPEKQKSRLSPSTRFRIHYDTTGSHTPALLNSAKQPIPNSYEAYVDSVAKYFDFSWRAIVDSLGYGAPPNDGTEGGGPEYDVYLEDLGAGVSGFTTWDPTKPIGDGPNKRFATYIFIDNDFLFVRTQGIAGLKITAAHEFFHAVQVGSYGIWTNIPNADFYFYELSSVWMEDLLFTGVNDYLFDLPVYFQQFRDLQGRSFSFTIFNPLYQGYERSIWAHYLTKRFGLNVIRQTWEAMRTEPFLKGMESVLNNYSTSLAEEYATFSQWNYFTANRADTVRFYPEGKYYPSLSANLGQSYDGFSTTSVIFQSYPLSTQVCVFGSSRDTITAIVANVNRAQAIESKDVIASFEIRLSGSTPTIPYQNLNNGIKAGFSAGTLADWRTVYMQTSTRADAKVAAEPSPNPVRVSEIARITLPVSTAGQDAEVFLFSSSLDLLYSGTYPVTEYLGKRYVYLPTRDFRSRVASGIYFVVVQCSDSEYRWKVALIQ